MVLFGDIIKHVVRELVSRDPWAWEAQLEVGLMDVDGQKAAFELLEHICFRFRGFSHSGHGYQ